MGPSIPTTLLTSAIGHMMLKLAKIGAHPCCKFETVLYDVSGKQTGYSTNAFF
jgi:hypothetical protein